MKFTKSNPAIRIFATLLALLMILSAQIFCLAHADESAPMVIYVSPDGSDDGNGSRTFPFATITKAFLTIDGSSDTTVVLMGDVESENKEAWNLACDAIEKHTALITITGKDPVTEEIYENVKLRYDTPVLKGPTKLEYLTLVPSRDFSFIDTLEHTLIFGKGVTKENFMVYVHNGINGVSKVTTVEKTDMVINDGEVDTLYMGGAYAKSTKNKVLGDCTLTINGGSASTVYIGFDKYAADHTKASIDGNVVINLNGGSIRSIKTLMLNDNSIGGAFVIIANNPSLIPSYTAPNAKKGEYIIQAELGGKVFYTGEPGVFGYESDKKHTCYVDGEKVEGDTFTVEPGTHTVTFVREKRADYMGSFIDGFPDNTFRPDEKLTRAQAAQIVLNAIGKPVLQDENFVSSFSDIKSSDWYYSAVSYLEKNDVLPSEWQNELLPNENITRGEYLYIIDGMMLKPADSVKVPVFSDITEQSTPYYSAITTAAASGCVTGYEDGTFRPENDLTRAEAVTFINRYLSRTPAAGAVSSFSDMKGHWADGQVIAASVDKSENKWDYAKDTDTSVFVIPESAENAKDYITALYNESPNLSGKAIRKGTNDIAERMKTDILNTPNTLEIYGDRITGKIYHISEKGSDTDGDGSVEKPFRSIAGLSVGLRYGDAVLFERGGIYRGTFSVTAGVVYGSYGKGNKPIVMQSRKNYASPDLWEKTEWENVWVCTEELMNVGIIGFDHDLQDYSESSYNEIYGITMNNNLFGFYDASQLCGDLQFYSELNGSTSKYGKLYLYSKDGNPGERFSSIEMGEKIDIVRGSAKDVVIDNISFKFTGAHGMGGAGGAVNRTVTNCIYSWLGGSVLSLNFSNGKPVNYGNAVEIYGGCNGYYVENNWMYQIYDTAVTHQRSSTTGNCIQENIRYSKNLMEYVFWGIEFYNCPPTASQLGGAEDTYTRITRNVTSEYNLLRLGGYGWGSIVRHRGSQLYWGMTVCDTENCYARYNIFDRAYGNLLGVPANSNEIEDSNIYIQHVGQLLGNLKKAGTVVCDYDMAQRIARDFGDKNAVVVLIDPLTEPIVRNIPEGLIAPDALE